MSTALNYQLSIFGKYDILPTPEIISALMQKINMETQKIFLPNLISSQQIEIPTNRITTIANLGFVTQDRQYSITILNERIDVNYNRTNDNELNVDEFYSFAVKTLTAIINFSNIISNRLAINIQQACFSKNSSEVMEIGKKLMKYVAYYNDKEFAEWSIRTNSQIDLQIDDLQEKLNVITDISSGQDILAKKSVILFHIDINTVPQNQNMRFDANLMQLFVDNTKPVAKSLITDVERLILDEK